MLRILGGILALSFMAGTASVASNTGYYKLPIAPKVLANRLKTHGYAMVSSNRLQNF